MNWPNDEPTRYEILDTRYGLLQLCITPSKCLQKLRGPTLHHLAPFKTITSSATRIVEGRLAIIIVVLPRVTRFNDS